MVDGGHTLDTHTDRQASQRCSTPDAFGIVIIHGVRELLAGPDKWNYTGQMRWLHTCVYTVCVCVFYI